MTSGEAGSSLGAKDLIIWGDKAKSTNILPHRQGSFLPDFQPNRALESPILAYLNKYPISNSAVAGASDP
jgi:hypothetical protein